MVETNTKVNAILFGWPNMKISFKTEEAARAFEDFSEVIESDVKQIDAIKDDKDRVRLKCLIANVCTFLVDNMNDLEFTEEETK